MYDLKLHAIRIVENIHIHYLHIMFSWTVNLSAIHRISFKSCEDVYKLLTQTLVLKQQLITLLYLTFVNMEIACSYITPSLSPFSA